MKFSILSKSILVFFIACSFSQTFAIENSRLKFIKEDIQKLNSKDHSEILDELFNEANEIGIINDRCHSISLTDKVDDACKDFYRVTLPNFEKKYSKVTGEIRIGALQINKNLKGQIENLKACLDALESFFFINPVSYFIKEFKEETIPLDLDGKKAEYILTTYFKPDADFIRNVYKQVGIWNKSCVGNSRDPKAFLVPAVRKVLPYVKGFYRVSEDFKDENEFNKIRNERKVFYWFPREIPLSTLYVNGEIGFTLYPPGGRAFFISICDDACGSFHDFGLDLGVHSDSRDFSPIVFKETFDNNTKGINAFWSDVYNVNLE